MPKQKFCQQIYSLNSYRRAYSKEPYNVLRGVVVDGALRDVPVTDVSFTRKIPSHASFLGYFDRLHFDVPAKEGRPHEGENRPVDIPFSTLCSVWADPAEMSVYVVSDKSPEETAPFASWGDDKTIPVRATHGQIVAHNKRRDLMREYKERVKNYRVDTAPAVQ